jgi:hypothetical protein
MNLVTAFISTIPSDDIPSASYNVVLTAYQLFLWRLGTLHSNTLQCAVSKWSFMWSVVGIYPSIQLHNYACNVLLIGIFSL